MSDTTEPNGICVHLVDVHSSHGKRYLICGEKDTTALCEQWTDTVTCKACLAIMASKEGSKFYHKLVCLRCGKKFGRHVGNREVLCPKCSNPKKSSLFDEKKYSTAAIKGAAPAHKVSASFKTTGKVQQ